MSSRSEAEEYGKILQLVYLAECRNIKLKKQALNMNPSEVRVFIHKIIHQKYQERLLNSAKAELEIELKDTIQQTGKAPMFQPEFSLDDFSFQATSELEFDLKFFPSTASDNPGKEFYAYYER